VAKKGAVTRPQLGEVLNLSKPTMSAAIAELSKLGLVEATGSLKGPMGRTAAVYGLGPMAGYVIGMDVGALQIRAVAYTLDGQSLASVEHQLTAREAGSTAKVSERLAEMAEAVIAAIGDRQTLLRCIAVAVPRIVATSALNRRRPPEAVLDVLRRRFAVPVLIENNVNCAALGEMLYGAARNRQTFVFLQVGVRIGLGIVLNGQLFRGFHGAAGEVGRMPFPWSEKAIPVREGVEAYLGSEALVARCGAAWDDADEAPPSSAKELFEMAERGSATASLWVKRHAHDIGRLVAGCIGLLDPGLVVLGGGVGQNALLRGEVETIATGLTWSTDIASSSLGNSGTVLGAMQLAADYGLGLILGDTVHPAVVLQPLGD